MVGLQPSKLITRVQIPVGAPILSLPKVVNELFALILPSSVMEFKKACEMLCENDSPVSLKSTDAPINAIVQYGERKAPCRSSSCCDYLNNHRVERYEIERIIEAAEKTPEIFQPEYRERVLDIVKSKRFFEEGKNYSDRGKCIIKNDKSRGRGGWMGGNFFACYFKAEEMDPTGRIIDSACMIYPVRFELCKGHSCDGCLEI